MITFAERIKAAKSFKKSIDWCDFGAFNLSHLVLKIDYK